MPLDASVIGPSNTHLPPQGIRDDNHLQVYEYIKRMAQERHSLLDLVLACDKYLLPMSLEDPRLTNCDKLHL